MCMPMAFPSDGKTNLRIRSKRQKRFPQPTVLTYPIFITPIFAAVGIDLKVETPLIRQAIHLLARLRFANLELCQSHLYPHEVWRYPHLYPQTTMDLGKRPKTALYAK